MARRTVDKQLMSVNVPLTGKCITAVDSSAIGLGNFQVLRNLRPGGTNPEPIRGMTKINTTAITTNTVGTTGIHFTKDIPTTESHVLVHATDINGANGKIYRNTNASLPSQNDFASSSLFSDSSGAGSPRLAIGPLGAAFYCNGVDTVMWPGLEARCAGYVDYNPDGSYRYNYTRQITNDLTDSDNLATIHRYSQSADAYTMLLLHLDNNVLDSSPTTPHTVTNNNVTFSDSIYKCGTHAAYFGGTNSDLTIPDNADFDYSAGIFTIDLQYRHDTTMPDDGDVIYYQQGATVNDYIKISLVRVSSFSFRVRLEIYEDSGGSPSELITLTTANTISLGSFNHIAFVENGNNWYAFLRGSLEQSVISANRAANYTGTVYIGSKSSSANYLRGYIDEFRISNTARWTSSFDPPTQAYGATNLTSILIASPLPLDGINWYVQTENVTAGASTVYYWNGSGSWVSVGTITGAGGTAFSTAAKHTWTFSSTKDTAKQRVIDGMMAYWYKVEIVDCDTTAQIYQVTLSSPMQQVRDLWDGTYRRVSAFLKYQSNTYSDLTTGVFKEEYDNLNASTFAVLDSLPATTSYLLGGFTERMQGLRFAFIPGKENSTAGTVMTIYKWNGTGWDSVGTIDDGTMEGGISFAKSGVVTWDPPALSGEFETDLPGASRPIFSKEELYASTPKTGSGLFSGLSKIREITKALATGAKTIDRPQLYYYKIEFSKALDSEVELYFVGGIPVQMELKGYDFPFEHLSRIWLAKDNNVLASATGTSQIFNGEEALEFPVGGTEKLQAAASLVTRAGANLYSVLLLLKSGQLYALYGSDPEEMVGPVKIADVGITAVETLRVIPAFEVGPGVSRPIAVWQASDGIFMSDGFSVTELSKDISDRFDNRKSTCINRTYASSSFAGYDSVKNQYHWCYAEGSATAPDKEWVFRFGVQGWYEIVRPTANKPKAFIPVTDSQGNAYMFAMEPAGYLMRLENGATFDGTAIAYSFRPADLALIEGDLSEESKVRYVKLVCKANNSTANKIAATHYVDADSNGTVIDSSNNLAPQIASRRVAQIVKSVNFDGVLHSTLFSLSVDAGTEGLEPLFLSYYIEPWRLDKGYSQNTPV